MLEEIAKWQSAKKWNVLLRNTFKTTSTFKYFSFPYTSRWVNCHWFGKHCSVTYSAFLASPKMPKPMHTDPIDKLLSTNYITKGFTLSTRLNPFGCSELSTDLNQGAAKCFAERGCSQAPSERLGWVVSWSTMKSENKAQRNKQKISTVFGDFELCLCSISKVCFECLKKSRYSGARSRSSISSSDE